MVHKIEIIMRIAILWIIMIVGPHIATSNPVLKINDIVIAFFFVKMVCGIQHATHVLVHT